MPDPTDYISSRQRQALLVLLAVYIGLYVVQFVTGNEGARAATDIMFGVLFVPGSMYVVVRMRAEGVEEPVPYIAAGSTLFAGITIGYHGISLVVDQLPITVAVDLLGTFSLLVALIAYFYWRS